MNIRTQISLKDSLLSDRERVQIAGLLIRYIKIDYDKDLCLLKTRLESAEDRLKRKGYINCSGCGLWPSNLVSCLNKKTCTKKYCENCLHNMFKIPACTLCELQRFDEGYWLKTKRCRVIQLNPKYMCNDCVSNIKKNDRILKGRHHSYQVFCEQTCGYGLVCDKCTLTDSLKKCQKCNYGYYEEKAVDDDEDEDDDDD